MKKTPETSSEPTPARLRNILLSGNDRGGVGKTFNNVQLGDALESLGYNISYVDADLGSASLRQIVPSARTITIATNTRELDAETERELDDLFASVAEDAESDLTIVDFGAGTTAATLGLYFRKKGGRHLFDQIGVRILAGISINSDDESLKCSLPWLRSLGAVAEFITLASHEKPIALDIHNLPAAEGLLDVCEQRIIHFKKLSPVLLEHYSDIKGRAGDYVDGGPLAGILGLNIFDTAGWNDYRTGTILSVFPYAQWLTGKEAPTPPHPSLLHDGTQKNAADAAVDKMLKSLADKRNLRNRPGKR